ncbi:hypothetical protein BH23GEM7_BH23GEM7_18690 [soil metagenome]
MPRAFLLILVLMVSVPAAGTAQTGLAGGGDHASAPVAHALRATESIRIDGRLDEAAWASATPVTEFTQLVPTEGAPATERTEIRFLYDDEALYIGARMYDRGKVTTRLGRRDMSMEATDWLTVIIDSYHDHRTAFGFEVNPSGVRRDQTRAGEGEDDSWDPVWEAATSVDAEGWTAELRIPFSQLRFNPIAEQLWGIQIERQIARNREFSVFSFTPTSQPGGIPRFGHLHGLRELRTGKRLEVLPYSVMRADNVDRSANPYRDNREYDASAGVDLKYRVTSDLTLDVTVNPDFGQVEVDPAEVNLSAIETFFQEKRPFFVEGSEIFNFGAGGGNNAFYSRRIGRAPQILPQTPARDVADAAGILGAAKLSGRTRNGWSVGVLNALTGREDVLFRDGQGLDQRTTAEPLTNYFVGRLRRDFRAGQSVFGGMFTAVNRDLDTELLRSTLRSAAYTGGTDFRHEWAQRTWVLNGFVSGSYVQGSREAITLAQMAPWHYFQRPDADHLELDPNKTSLLGMSTQVQLQYRQGRHWRYSLLGGTTTPEYEVNDIGFQYRADRIDGQASVTYVENRPGSFLRSWQVTGSARAERNYDFEHVMNVLSVNTTWQHLNYWVFRLNGNYFLPSFDDRLTRGGPAADRPGSGTVWLALYSDSRRPLAMDVETSYQRNDAGGWNGFVGVGVNARPAPSWNFSVIPALFRTHSKAQYLGLVDDARATETFGRRYLFSELDQTTLSIQTRLNVTFTPALSLQVFAQPFISSADFGAPAQLRAPRSYDFLVYGRDVGAVDRLDDGSFRIFPEGREGLASPFVLSDRDFNLRSLRGNAVLRWEWRPGSTLYLAWQQTRDDFAPLGDFDLGRDRAALFSARPDNVLVLKVNYWLNP